MEKPQSEEVVLFGTWASAHCTRVQLALKLKGVAYAYVEEDLINKSDSLLHYNPVHKKVPVLVHKGKPIAESLVILEYIDDCWNTSPKLLPLDPYPRAKVRFWANFFDQKIIPSSYAIILSKGKEQENAIKEFNQLLSAFEEGIEKDFSTKFPSNGGNETLGFLEIVVGSHACNYRAFEEAVGAIVDPKEHPAFLSWVAKLKECPLMNETLPPHDKLVAKMREKIFQAPKA